MSLENNTQKVSSTSDFISSTYLEISFLSLTQIFLDFQIKLKAYVDFYADSNGARIFEITLFGK